MTEQRTEIIKFWGIVQGVGFRPFVAKTAHRLRMNGQVRNIGGLVEILVTDTKEQIDTFVQTIEKETIPPAEIVHIKRSEKELQTFDDFTIVDSHPGKNQPVMIPADSAICPDCLAELREPGNPRYNHPFISCMACGPRYTIIDRVPYDRDNTTMIDFSMCDVCLEEYTNLQDRRYHAQTISCHQCGPKLNLNTGVATGTDTGINETGNTDVGIDENVTGDFAIKSVAKSLKQGQVIAFKSMGGYNLVCDPFNDQGVDKLRQIKKRDQKPFALMFKDLGQIKQYCHVDEIEAKLLQSSARPILLLERKQCDPEQKPFYKGRNPHDVVELSRSRFIGAFLPSMGAQYLLLDQISPLIFTSANTSDMPMIKDDWEIDAMIKKEFLINSRLGNDRDIRVRVDDSVVRVIDGQPQMIRRARGYAPRSLYINANSKKQFLATGGQLKNSFALSKGSFVYMSQYFGDLDSVENQEIYKENIERLQSLFRIKPKAIICDLHPLYFTTKFAKEQKLPLLQVQHHHAHVASVMAEHNLPGKVIGVSFDGTGYGTDGAIWGGEFLLCEQGKYQRVNHLSYVDMPGGDTSMKEAWKSAVCYRYAWEKDEATAGIRIDIEDILTYAGNRTWQEEDIVRKALEHGVNTIKSSSMGRLFDAVSALLGIKDYNDYEGQCAMLLEDAAARAIRGEAKDQADELALAFHKRIANMILEQCVKTGETKQVALTGGVFQNKVLMEETLKLLRDRGFEPYYNISVSPNDGGLALGQIYIALQRGMSWQ